MITFILMSLVTLVVMGSITAYIAWDSLTLRERSIASHNIQSMRRTVLRRLKGGR